MLGDLLQMAQFQCSHGFEYINVTAARRYLIGLNEDELEDADSDDENADTDTDDDLLIDGDVLNTPVVISDLLVENSKVIPIHRHLDYAYRGESLKDLSLLEYQLLVGKEAMREDPNDDKKTKSVTISMNQLKWNRWPKRLLNVLQRGVDLVTFVINLQWYRK